MIMHEEPATSIPAYVRTESPFSFLSDDASDDRIKLLLKWFIFRGLIHYESPNVVKISDFVEIEGIRQLIYSAGYHGRLIYDPIAYFVSEHKKIIVKYNDRLIVINDFSAAEMERLVLAVWEKYEEQAFWNVMKANAFIKRKIAAEEFVFPQLRSLTREFLLKMDVGEIAAYPPLLNRMHFRTVGFSDFSLESVRFVEFVLYKHYFETKGIRVIPHSLSDVYTTSL